MNQPEPEVNNQYVAVQDQPATAVTDIELDNQKKKKLIYIGIIIGFDLIAIISSLIAGGSFFYVLTFILLVIIGCVSFLIYPYSFRLQIDKANHKLFFYTVSFIKVGCVQKYDRTFTIEDISEFTMIKMKHCLVKRVAYYVKHKDGRLEPCCVLEDSPCPMEFSPKFDSTLETLNQILRE